jgi:hypothetical protein
VDNSPLNSTDPFGLYDIKTGVPLPGPRLDNLLTCMEWCIGTPFLVTGTYRPGDPGAHGQGLAADIRYPDHDRPVTDTQFLCCALKCRAGYARNELRRPVTIPDGTLSKPHIHVQIPPNRSGGHGDLQGLDCSKRKCGEKAEGLSR